MGAYIPKGGRENPRGGPFGAHAYIMPHVQCDETYLLGKKDNVVPVVGKMYQPQTQKEKAFLTTREQAEDGMRVSMASTKATPRYGK